MADKEKHDKKSDSIFDDDWDISPNDDYRDSHNFVGRNQFSFLGLFLTICGSGVFLFACYFGYLEYKEWQLRREVVEFVNEFTNEMEKEQKRYKIMEQQRKLQNQRKNRERAEKNRIEIANREFQLEQERKNKIWSQTVTDTSEYERFDPNTYRSDIMYKDEKGVWRNY